VCRRDLGFAAKADPSRKVSSVTTEVKDAEAGGLTGLLYPAIFVSVSLYGTTTLEPDLSGRSKSRLGILLKNPTCGPGSGAAGGRKPVRTTRASVRTASGAIPDRRQLGYERLVFLVIPT
jgi:hypothetical protein